MKNTFRFIIVLVLTICFTAIPMVEAFAATEESKNNVLWDMIFDDLHELIGDFEKFDYSIHTLYKEGDDDDIKYSDPEKVGEKLRIVLKDLEEKIENDEGTFSYGCEHIETIAYNTVLYGPWSDWLYSAEANICKQRYRLVVIICANCDEYIIAVEWNDDIEHNPKLEKKGYCPDCGFILDDEDEEDEVVEPTSKPKTTQKPTKTPKPEVTPEPTKTPKPEVTLEPTKEPLGADEVTVEGYAQHDTTSWKTYAPNWGNPQYPDGSEGEDTEGDGE